MSREIHIQFPFRVRQVADNRIIIEPGDLQLPELNMSVADSDIKVLQAIDVTHEAHDKILDTLQDMYHRELVKASLQVFQLAK